MLVDKEIRHEVESNGSIHITPYNKENINPNSYDLTLGDSLIEYPICSAEYDSEHIIDPYDEVTIKFRTKKINFEEYVLYPAEYILGVTVEHISIAPDMVAFLDGKSSLARLGLSIHQTGGFIDGGFSGTITLEISNSNVYPIRLYSGMKIGQIRFERTNGCCKPYNARSHSKYMNQSDPELSRYYQNEKPQNGVIIRQKP